MVKIEMVTWSGTRELYRSDEPQTCDVCGTVKYPGQWICHGTDWRSLEPRTWCSDKCFKIARGESAQEFDIPMAVPAHLVRLILPIQAAGFKFIGTSWQYLAAQGFPGTRIPHGKNLSQKVAWTKSQPCRGRWNGRPIWEYTNENETEHYFRVETGDNTTSGSLWFVGKVEPSGPYSFSF